MLFAFGRSSGTFYISNGSKNYWKGIPSSLSSYLQNDYLLQAISFGEGGAWFYSESAHSGTNGSYCLSAATAVNYPRVSKIYDSDEKINWVAFGPDGEYVVDTVKRIYASNDSIARTYKSSGNRVPLRCASFGYDDAWVSVEDDGEVRSHGLSAKIKSALNKKPVRNVQLSADSPSTYFIEYVDGETDWCLPTSWHTEVQNVERMTVRLDEPGVPGTQSVSQRIIFAFGHKISTYCISNGGQASWKGISDDVVTEKLRRAGTMEAFSLGENGSCFWSQGGSTWLSSETEMAYPEVWRIWKSDETINWVAFGPQGYYIIDTDTRLKASRGDIILRNYKEGKRVPLRCASFGYGCSWVVVEDDGIIRSHGLSKKVLEKVKVGNVRNVQLSMTDVDHCYVEYMDGTSDWIIPKAWHETVSKVEGNLPTPSTASNTANTGNQRLHTVLASDPEFHSISFQFSTSWRHTDRALPKVRYIYRISPASSSSESAHKAYVKRIGNEQKLWHATRRQCKLGDDGRGLQLCADSKCALCQIVRTSYQKKFAIHTGMFGTGIYSSTTSSKAAGYSKNNQVSKYNAILLNNVAVGRMHYTNQADRGRTAPPSGYDSVCGLPGSALKFDETCVYDDDAIRPTYLILYDAKS